eukprot:jgi/Chrpa1/18804/Chrysochromulina_OHIO_Genome00028019-RA
MLAGLAVLLLGVGLQIFEKPLEESLVPEQHEMDAQKISAPGQQRTTHRYQNRFQQAVPEEVHPQVLVIVSDHGSGTTSLGRALDSHPCVVDVGEPFGPAYQIWSNSSVTECDSYKGTDAIFDAQSGKLQDPRNEKIVEKVGKALDDFGVQLKESAYDSLYDGLKYNLAEYFVRVRDFVCANVPEDVCPPSDCTIVTKFFPNYINGDTNGETGDPRTGKNPKCVKAMNAKAIVSWQDALVSMEQNPKVATLQLTRDENDRQFSIFHRFNPEGSEFDCGVPRPFNEFITMASEHTDAHMKVENCWQSATDADKCLSDGLKLVGLSEAPMGHVAAQFDKEAALAVMLGETKLPSDHKAASKSCATDPTAIFKRLENYDVKVVGKSKGSALLNKAAFEKEAADKAAAEKAAAEKAAAEKAAAEKAAAEKAAAEKAAAEKAAAEKAAAEKAAAEQAAAEQAAAEKAAAEKAAAEQAAADQAAADQAAADQAAADQELHTPTIPTAPTTVAYVPGAKPHLGLHTPTTPTAPTTVAYVPGAKPHLGLHTPTTPTAPTVAA